MPHARFVRFAGSVSAVIAISTVTGTTLAGGVTVQPKAGDPVDGLSPLEMQRFLDGQFDYSAQLLAEEGLGPVFNKDSCGNCHNAPLGGPGSQTVTRFGAFGKAGFDPLEDFGGSLLQVSSIDPDNCQEVVPDEADFTTQRRTKGMLGYGLVEAIPDADIMMGADPTDANADGISGRVHMVGAFEDPIGAPLRAGRFGWKGQLATILSFSADAAQNELGFSNRLIPFDNDPNGSHPPALEDCDDIPDPEDGPDGEGLHFIDRVTFFQRYLAAPPQTPRSGMTGETIFMTIGCGQCHTPSFTTSNSRTVEPALRGKVIKPYSDFLLHDMGVGGDPIVQGDAMEREVVTPPLWGVGTRNPMLHNGSANAGTFEGRIAQVITQHASFLSEAADSANQFQFVLTETERGQVLDFLRSLGQLEFDSDGDADVDLEDFHGFVDTIGFRPCFDAGAVTPDDPCAIHDVDQDGDVDMDDFNVFLTAYTGPLDDCNFNGTLDLEDILLGTSMDANNNGIPDECCVGDTDLSGEVDSDDILNVINAWGTDGSDGTDINGDGTVNVEDILLVINSWGTCPGL